MRRTSHTSSRNGVKMSVVDILDEITQKQVTKTKMGEERIWGPLIGIVAENYDKNLPGRICVNIPVRDENANQLLWAKVMAPYSGKGWGQYFIPEKQDEVVVLFEDGNIHKPYVIGALAKDNDKLLKKSADENNNIKNIMTRNGSRITFTDDTQEEGEKDKIEIETAGQQHHILVDNEAKKIVLADKEKNCEIVMKTENGEIAIHAAKKLKITVGDSIQVILDGDSGSIKIKADKYTLETSGNINQQADGNFKISGKQTTMEAASSASISSSGMVKVEGKPIKMG